MSNIYHKLYEIECSQEKAALCLIIDTKGSTPRKVGAKMVVNEHGNIWGTIGGGSLERQVIQDALGIIQSQKAVIFKHALVHDHGMCCGGSVQIYIEPVMNKKALYIFGAGHIGAALANLASQLDFQVTLIDGRAGMLDDFDETQYNLIPKHHELAFQELQFNENVFIAVMTHDHAFDRSIVAHCANQNFAYLGMIGSVRKVEIAKKIFRTANSVSDEQIARIDWPMGLPMMAQTPKEIAISILAKLIDVRSRLLGVEEKTLEKFKRV